MASRVPGGRKASVASPPLAERCGRGDAAELRAWVEEHWKWSSKSVKQALWKLKSQLRAMAAPLRQASMSFAYDPESYSRNFDDGFFHDDFAPTAPAKDLF